MSRLDKNGILESEPRELTMPEGIKLLKSVRKWLVELFSKYPEYKDNDPNIIFSGPPFKYKCQIAWFAHIAAHTDRLEKFLPDELGTDELTKWISLAGNLSLDIQKRRRTDLGTKRHLVSQEDIKRGDEILQSFINEIDRILSEMQ
ncbi:hypothetical protein KKA33_00430 [Patescibacteria group bacterium]|nr:hypothetical protein [Patescibacteria group bacterium]